MIVAIYRKLIIYSIYLAPIVLLIVRLSWGWESFESGRAHLSHDHFQDTVSFFDSLHIPAPKASVIISGSVEVAGGILLMLGLGSRLIAVPLAINFCMAIVTASKDNVANFFHQDPSKIVDDTAFPFLIASLIILAFGPGLFSIDAILKRTLFKRHSAGLPNVAA